MRIGQAAAAEAIKAVACPYMACWEDAQGARGLAPFEDGAVKLPGGARAVGNVVVHVRRIPPRLVRKAELEHMGETQRIAYESTGRRGRQQGVPQRSFVEIRKADASALQLELLSFALYDITTTIPKADGFEPAEVEIVDDKTAARVWGMLSAAERERVGQVHAGTMLAVSGLLPSNEALRGWVLEEMPGLWAFVDEQADRLTRAAIEGEAGKGETSLTGASSSSVS